MQLPAKYQNNLKISRLLAQVQELLDEINKTEPNKILFKLERQGINLLSESRPMLKENLLLPRRREIIELIIDHPLVTFNFIQRRFMAVPGRTLRYDLKYLSDHKFILKLGSTKGVLYSPNSDRN